MMIVRKRMFPSDRHFLREICDLNAEGKYGYSPTETYIDGEGRKCSKSPSLFVIGDMDCEPIRYLTEENVDDYRRRGWLKSGKHRDALVITEKGMKMLKSDEDYCTFDDQNDIDWSFTFIR